MSEYIKRYIVATLNDDYGINALAYVRLCELLDDLNDEDFRREVLDSIRETEGRYYDIGTNCP